jgi:hypothetical protein
MAAYFLYNYFFPIFGLLTGGFVLARIHSQQLACSADRPVPLAWTCSRAIAQDSRSLTGHQKEITTGEGNRLRHAFHTHPAVALRKHGEVHQICGGHPLARRRNFFFGLFLLGQAPPGCRFEPVLTEHGYGHRSEDVCYRVQRRLPFSNA